MKTFKIMLMMLTLSIGIVSCNNDDNINPSSTQELAKSDNLSNRISESEEINILFNGKRYELLEDNSVAFYNEEDNYIGDIVLGSYDMKIQDDSNSNGEITVTNPSTNEIITIKNIRNEDDKTIFDVKTSNGLEFIGLEGYQTNSTYKVPIVPIVRAVVAIVTVIAVAVSSGGTQADCTASMPKNCPPGYAPYAEYSSGWFSSSCNIGCRK